LQTKNVGIVWALSSFLFSPSHREQKAKSLNTHPLVDAVTVEDINTHANVVTASPPTLL
jgi:hypothetical protein